MQNKNKNKNKAIKKQKNNKRSNKIKKFSKNGNCCDMFRACAEEIIKYRAETKDRV